MIPGERSDSVGICAGGRPGPGSAGRAVLYSLRHTDTDTDLLAAADRMLALRHPARALNMAPGGRGEGADLADGLDRVVAGHRNHPDLAAAATGRHHRDRHPTSRSPGG